MKNEDQLLDLLLNKKKCDLINIFFRFNSRNELLKTFVLCCIQVSEDYISSVYVVPFHCFAFAIGIICNKKISLIFIKSFMRQNCIIYFSFYIVRTLCLWYRNENSIKIVFIIYCIIAKGWDLSVTFFV